MSGPKDLKKKVEEIYKTKPDQKYVILFDLTKPGLFIDSSSMFAVGIYYDIVNLEQTKRIAILGNSSFADPILDVAFEKVADKKANWFTDREKALRWLGIKK